MPHLTSRNFFDSNSLLHCCTRTLQCYVSLNLLIKLNNVHLFSTCSSAILLQNRCCPSFLLQCVILNVFFVPTHISFHLRFFDFILPKYKMFGASERAAAMSSVPSSLKSPTAKPYTVPFESPKEIDLKLRPVPSLKNTVDGASTWPTMISTFLSLFRSAIANA